MAFTLYMLSVKHIHVFFNFTLLISTYTLFIVLALSVNFYQWYNVQYINGLLNIITLTPQTPQAAPLNSNQRYAKISFEFGGDMN